VVTYHVCVFVNMVITCCITDLTCEPGVISCHIILYCSCTCQCWSTSNYITSINCCHSL